MQRKLTRFSEAMESINTFDFDPLKLSNTLQRDNVFTMTVYQMITSLPKVNSDINVNTDKLISFLTTIAAGYRKSVEYHNDLHGCDVA